MLRKRKEPKAKKSVAEALLRDMQGTAAQKLALFEKLKARGGFEGEDRAELLKVQNMLRTFAATEKGGGEAMGNEDDVHFVRVELPNALRAIYERASTNRTLARKLVFDHLG